MQFLQTLFQFCKVLAGSFSAVSKRNFARKYAFDSIFQALQDLHPFAPLQSQNFRKKSVWKNSNFREISAKKFANVGKFANFVKFQRFQLENLVDFEKCCKTHIYLQKSVPIQPKTSDILPKICEKLTTTLRVPAVHRASPSVSEGGGGRRHTSGSGLKRWVESPPNFQKQSRSRLYRSRCLQRNTKYSLELESR